MRESLSVIRSQAILRSLRTNHNLSIFISDHKKDVSLKRRIIFLLIKTSKDEKLALIICLPLYLNHLTVIFVVFENNSTFFELTYLCLNLV